MTNLENAIAWIRELNDEDLEYCLTRAIDGRISFLKEMDRHMHEKPKENGGFFLEYRMSLQLGGEMVLFLIMQESRDRLLKKMAENH